jgi:thiamine pyrophosphokinase
MLETRARRANEDDDHSRSYITKQASGGQLYLVSEASITFVLQQGKNTIHTPGTKRPDLPQTESRSEDESHKRKRDEEKEPEYFFEENIGIIPLTGPTSITTEGFEWDVQDWHTSIGGGPLSTSNHIRADVVSVEAPVPILFTVELAERLRR